MKIILPKNEWMKVLKGAGVAAAGAALTYLTQWLTGSEVGGEWTPALVAMLSVLANYVRKIASQTTPEPTPES